MRAGTLAVVLPVPPMATHLPPGRQLTDANAFESPLDGAWTGWSVPAVPVNDTAAASAGDISAFAPSSPTASQECAA